MIKKYCGTSPSLLIKTSREKQVRRNSYISVKPNFFEYDRQYWAGFLLMPQLTVPAHTICNFLLTLLLMITTVEVAPLSIEKNNNSSMQLLMDTYSCYYVRMFSAGESWLIHTKIDWSTFTCGYNSSPSLLHRASGHHDSRRGTWDGQHNNSTEKDPIKH